MGNGNKKTVAFVGVSGNGMSPLAQILALKGWTVFGSDRDFDLGRDEGRRRALESVGIKIIPQDGSGIAEGIETVYTTTAADADIPDLAKANELGIPVVKRFDLLAELFHQYPRGVAVGGTSGKTTTTAMIGYILDKLGKKPTVINGGILVDYESRPGIANYIYSDGDICVIEADESNGSIAKYVPEIAVVSNVSVDHKSLPELVEIFQNFVKKAKAGAVLNADDPNSKTLFSMTGKKIVSFSVDGNPADLMAADITPLPGGTSYKISDKIFHVKQLGKFNVANALAAIAACMLLGVDEFEAAKALETFSGTKRRLEIVAVTKNNVTVIDDFAHNPEKVKASVSALKAYPGRLIVMFQPHGFAPMKITGRGIMESFAQTLHNADGDMLLMPDIFTIDGTFDPAITSKMLTDYAAELGADARYIPERNAIKDFILGEAKPGDRVVVMGARDVTLSDFAKTIANKLSSS